MKILGCFKISANLELLTEADWMEQKNNRVNTDFVKTEWNCFDESALEMMLKLSDLSEGFNVFVRLNALTIGGEICDSYLKQLYALKFDQAVRIEPEENPDFSPAHTAALIENYVNYYGETDVLIMGSRSSVGENGKTPLLTAELLGWPCVTQVIAVQLETEETLLVKNETDAGIQTQTVKCPCVLTVGNAPDSYLRIPTLQDRMKYGKKEILVLAERKLTEKGKEPPVREKEKLAGIEFVKRERNGQLLEGANPQEKAEKLYWLLKERLNKE